MKLVSKYFHFEDEKSIKIGYLSTLLVVVVASWLIKLFVDT